MSERPDAEPVDPGPDRAGDSIPERPPTTDLAPIVDACESADAAAFVAVGDRFDDDLRYLTRFSGPDREFALVVVPGDEPDTETDGEVAPESRGRAVLCAPALSGEQARREFVKHARRESGAFPDGVAREVRVENVGESAGRRAAAVIDDLVTGSDRTVLVPRSIPHDAAVFLERAGYPVTSTTAVADTRCVKTEAEIDCLRRVQRAAVAAMARAETVLAESDGEASRESDVNSLPASDVSSASESDVLRHDGDTLTTERLRREIDATLAERGVRDAGNTVVGAGTTAVDLHYRGADPIRRGETVLIDVSPRGPHGYYGDLTRTFVVDSDGGWERRAYVAVEAAREAALAEIGPGVIAQDVHREAAAELAAYGFDPDAAEGESGFTHGTGHGVGVSLHEAPSLTSDATLRAGHVVTVEPGVYDPDVGGVRLEDLVVVTDEGYELLAAYPFGTTPAAE